MSPVFESLASELGIPIGLLVFILVWSLVWKALALWKSARCNHPLWFIAFLVIHTLGILEILYLFLFSKLRLDKKKKSRTPKKSRKR